MFSSWRIFTSWQCFAREGSFRLIETFFRAFIILQPFIWFWILEYDRFEFLNREESLPLFTGLVFLWILNAGITQFSIGFYSTELLIFYPGLILVGTIVCIRDFKYSFKDALSLGFLIAYLNSFYWEGLLHVWAIQENGFNMNQIFQMLHLIPAIYFIWRWEFDVKESIDCLLVGWASSGLLTFLRRSWGWILPASILDSLTFPLNSFVMMINRIVCFYFLFNAIIRWGMPRINAFVPSFLNKEPEE